MAEKIRKNIFSRLCKPRTRTVRGKLLIVSIMLIFIFTFFSKYQKAVDANHSSDNLQLWPYQCIDTMKTSRDKARIWKETRNLHNNAALQMELILDIGANCVAIDTPYDKEFIPYLTIWVQEARKKNLHIWFRGNFSSWEGWFDYPKGMTSNELFEKTKQFILTNKNLFEDGDIFTPSPEAENGGPFNQVEENEHKDYRQFLIEEHKTTKEYFASIGKDVRVNWLSMNGGLARRMLDKNTIEKLENLVTIDHYIKTPQEMAEYISFFNNTFNARVAIGEFGAPIPEINGPMSEIEQARFVDKLLYELYKKRSLVEGVNYWVLYDSSTALLNDDGSPRKVVKVLKKYYQPLPIEGIVKNTLGEPLKNIQVGTRDGYAKANTYNNGKYSLLIPRQAFTIKYSGHNYFTHEQKIADIKHDKIVINITLTPIHKNFFYKIREYLLRFRNKEWKN